MQVNCLLFLKQQNPGNKFSDTTALYFCKYFYGNVVAFWLHNVFQILSQIV